MSKKVKAEPTKVEIVDRREMILIGCVFYGDPFHSAKGWSAENEIGLTWQRFNKLFEKNKDLIQKHRTDPNVTYEIHIEPDEYKVTKRFYIFVGVEIKKLDKIPLEMFVKILPQTKYAIFTFKGKNMFSGGQYIWNEWLPKSNYVEAYPFLIQKYDEMRFKGLENDDSEIDYYVSVKLKK